MKLRPNTYGYPYVVVKRCPLPALGPAGDTEVTFHFDLAAARLWASVACTPQCTGDHEVMALHDAPAYGFASDRQVGFVLLDEGDDRG